MKEFFEETTTFSVLIVFEEEVKLDKLLDALNLICRSCIPGQCGTIEWKNVFALRRCSLWQILSVTPLKLDRTSLLKIFHKQKIRQWFISATEGSVYIWFWLTSFNQNGISKPSSLYNIHSRQPSVEQIADTDVILYFENVASFVILIQRNLFTKKKKNDFRRTSND